MQSKETNGCIELFKVIKVSFNILSFKMDLRLKGILAFGLTDQILRDIIAHNFVDENSIADESFPELQGRQPVSTAKVNNG
jgi:hypothetical protein